MAGSAEVVTEPGVPIATRQVSGTLYWFASGTFAVGTEGFIIARLLPVTLRSERGGAVRALSFVRSVSELAVVAQKRIGQTGRDGKFFELVNAILSMDAPGLPGFHDAMYRRS